MGRNKNHRGLTVEGAGASISSLTTHTPSCVKKAISVCEQLDKGKVVTLARMAELIGMTHRAFRNAANDTRLQDFRIRPQPNGPVLFGSKTAIERAKQIYAKDE